MDIVFPETTSRSPQPRRRPLKLMHVLAVLYAFGGISVLAGIVSRFIVGPLLEQLTFDRQLYADRARQRLEEFNFSLARLVSKVPPTEYISRGLVDSQTQSSERLPGRIAPTQSKAREEPMQIGKFSELVRDIKVLPEDGDDSTMVTQGKEILQFLRNQCFNKADNAQHTAFRKEIREFKGVLISI